MKQNRQSMTVQYQQVHTRFADPLRRRGIHFRKYCLLIAVLISVCRFLPACSATPNATPDATPKPEPQSQVQFIDAVLSTPKTLLADGDETGIPTWHWDKSQLSQLVSNIQALAADGLNPEDYSLSELSRSADNNLQNVDRLATKSYLHALHDLAYGKVDPSQLDPDWNFTRPKVVTETDRKSAMAGLESGTIDTEFRWVRPRTPRYQNLSTALVKMQVLAQRGGWPIIPSLDSTEGGAVKLKSLKLGVIDSRVAPLRQRLYLVGLLEDMAEPDDPNFFDLSLELAVKRFQQESNLDADGAIGKQTLEQLNVPIGYRIAQLRVNLEQERWLAPKPNTYVAVDVAGYKIAYIQDGAVVWQSRVQVGQVERKTPIIQSAISHLTLNPQWSVPPTILRKDLLPAVRKDVAYLAKKHIRVFNAKNEELDAESIDWNHPGDIILRQDSGADAALGQLVIRFPNIHSVYLHETPYKTLFKASQRAFSSGCVRVENVRELGVFLLNNAEQWNRDGLEAVLTDGITREVNLPKRVPIFINYWTVNIADDGYIAFRPDIYQRDLVVLAALNGPAKFPITQ